MKYNQPFGNVDPDAAYVNGNPATATEGSIVPAEALEFTQREIVNFITDSNMVGSNAKTRQLSWGIQSGQVTYAADTGTADALVVTLDPVPEAIQVGMRVTVLKGPNPSKTTTPTLKVNTAAAATIVRRDASALVPFDIAGSQIFEAEWDGSKWRLMTIGAAEFARTTGPAGPTLYVRTDGSDTNDGSVNDAAHAFLTITAALAAASSRFNLTGRTLTIQLGIAGTYAGFVVSTIPNVQIIGNTGSIATYIISGTPQCVVAIGTTVTLRGMTMSTTGTNHCVQATSGGYINIQNCAFAGTNLVASAALLCASAGSTIIIGGPISSSIGGGYFAEATTGAIEFASVAVTLTGTPAFAVATIGATNAGTVIFDSGATWVGAATGSRYFANLNGVVNSGGSGASFIPGNAVGTTATGGQYA